MLSKARPRPSQLIRISADLSRLVNSWLVNCTPWSLLKISGVATRKARSNASKQKLGSRVIAHFPGQYRAAEPINHCHQVNETALGAGGGNVTTPNLVSAVHA